MFNVIHNSILLIDPYLDSSIGCRVELKSIFVTSFRVVPQRLLIRLVGDVREINKVVRTLKSQYVDGRIWPLKGFTQAYPWQCPMHLIATTVTNPSQRAHVIFLAEDRKLPTKGTYCNSGYDKQTHRLHGSESATRGSIIDYESHQITTTTQSTTVAELNVLMKCFGTCFVSESVIGRHKREIVPFHIRTDANNLVTTAQTTHLPEQKETHHLIQMLRHESNTGHLDDLSPIASEILSGRPTYKITAKPDQLVSSIATGKLEQVDVHPPFRSLLKHKAFLTTWVVDTLHEPHNVTTFFCEDISDHVFAIMYFDEYIFVSRKFASAISWLTRVR